MTAGDGSARGDDPASGLGRDFWWLWTASATSNLGDGIRLTALPLLAAAITTNPTAVAGVMAATYLPWLLFGAVGGAIADRSDRRRLIIAVQVSRAACAGVFAVSVAVGGSSLLGLYAVAVCISLGEVVVDGALQAVIPLVTPRDRLDAANGRMGAAQLLADEVLGGPVGALLFAFAAALPFAVDAVTFGLGALAFTQVRAPQVAGRPSSSSSLLHDVSEGVRWLSRHRLLRAFAVSMAVTNLGYAAGSSMLVLLVTDTFGASGIAFGWLISAAAAGGFVGTLLAERVARRTGRGRAMGITLTTGAALFAAVAAAPTIWVAAAAWTLITLSTGMFNVLGRSLRQTIVPDRMMGRVMGAFRVLAYGTVPLGAIGGGIIATALGIRAAFAAGFVINLMAALLFARVVSGSTVSDALAQAARTAGDDAA